MATKTKLPKCLVQKLLGSSQTTDIEKKLS